MRSLQYQHVGLTGYNASGKGSVAKYFEDQGYHLISLSDLLREEAATRNLEPTREHLTNLGRELRRKNSPGVLADMAIKRLSPNQPYVIDSIRHPDEIKIFRDHLPTFLLIGVDAPIDIRFERSQSRGRQENANTLEEFKKRENLEKKNNPNAQQLHRCIELCDVLILNDGTIPELQQKLKKVLSK